MGNQEELILAAETLTTEQNPEFQISEQRSQSMCESLELPTGTLSPARPGSGTQTSVPRNNTHCLQRPENPGHRMKVPVEKRSKLLCLPDKIKYYGAINIYTLQDAI